MNLFKYALLFFAFIGLTFLGCNQKSQSPDQPATNDAQNVTPLLKTSGSGAWIVRNSAHAVLDFYDANTGLALLLGVNDIPDFCSHTGGVDVINIKEVILPNADPALRRVLAKIKDNLYARIWKVDSKPSDNICSFINTVPSTAEGTVNLKYNDNDFNGLEHHNTFGYRANGKLQGQDGQLYHLTLTTRVTWDGVDPSTLKYTELNIVLKPIGK